MNDHLQIFILELLPIGLYIRYAPSVMASKTSKNDRHQKWETCLENFKKSISLSSGYFLSVKSMPGWWHTSVDKSSVTCLRTLFNTVWFPTLMVVHRIVIRYPHGVLGRHCPLVIQTQTDSLSRRRRIYELGDKSGSADISNMEVSVTTDICTTFATAGGWRFGAGAYFSRGSTTRFGRWHASLENVLGAFRV